MKKIIENSEYGVTIGVDEGMRDALERMKNQPIQESKLLGECVVCYDRFNCSTNKPVAFQCGHVVCISCIATGNLNDCPFCQEKVKKMIPLFV